MSELTEFIDARVAEDEQRARNDGADAMTGAWWKHYPEGAYYELQTRTLAASSRTLAECGTKRHLLDEALVWGEGCLDVMARYMAEVYAEHADFREEWRP